MVSELRPRSGPYNSKGNLCACAVQQRSKAAVASAGPAPGQPDLMGDVRLILMLLNNIRSADRRTLRRAMIQRFKNCLEAGAEALPHIIHDAQYAFGLRRAAKPDWLWSASRP